MSVVLVMNSGSSSFKYQLINPVTGELFASGLVERIGASSPGSVTHKTGHSEFEKDLLIPDYETGVQLMLDAFHEHGPDLDSTELVAVGHRAVQGGSSYSEPVLIDESVVAEIDRLSSLAPLHNPAAVTSIRAAMRIFPELPHAAVFDTAFHQTMPPEHYSYALEKNIAEEHGIRKYGFHGTSHAYVAREAAKFLGKELAETNIVTLHLGNGASATAVQGGNSLNTSMGMTPLEGLVMGTRTGDIDPAVIFHLHDSAGMDFAELDDLLNKRSGLLGMTGSGDMRDVQNRAADGDAAAQHALAVYYERVKFYVGGYFAQLGTLDAIVFTAGVGENSAPTRAGILSSLSGLGIEVDPERNEAKASGIRIISTDSSRVAVLVVPTNEELEIAKQTLSLIT